MKLLEIYNLNVKAGNKHILRGVNLSMRPGETHAIMGPNGSGKSTLASVIMGHPGYAITQGGVRLNGKLINSLDPDERARKGVFLSFQYPSEVPGLSIEHFLRNAFNAIHPQNNLSVVEFHNRFLTAANQLRIRQDLAGRGLNEGFSGGEKKKLEILQLALLEPSLGILDETDSGLDIDALKTVSAGVNALRTAKRSFLVITHYVRILKYVKPDWVHVMIDGRIVLSGDWKLAHQIEKRGYDWLNVKKK
ncbi:MAG: Fe-S cluster assembly ATPase SufC [Patescibacteria group bacterium]